MIFDPHSRSRLATRKIATHAAMLAAILFVWFLTMAASARFLPVSDTYLAIGPERSIVDNLPAEARILRTGNHSVVVNTTGDQAGKLLYDAGAWLVLPSLANGCLALRRG
jgi:hypothetical protein